MLARNFFLLVVCLLSLEPSQTAKILGFFSTPSPSHLILYTSLMKGLAERGHEVTVVNTLTPTGPGLKNYRNIYYPIDDGNPMDNLIANMLKGAEMKANIFTILPDLFKSIRKRSKDAIVHPRFQALKNETFDLVVIGWFLNDFQIGVAGHFQCPSVIVSTGKAFKLTRDFVASPSGVSHVPVFLLSYKGAMNFFQRLSNFLVSCVEFIGVNIINYYLYEPSYRELFPPDQYPSYDEVKKNVSLVLINNHFSEGIVEAYVPAMIDVGGMHIKSTPSPLPKDIHEWLDSATDGAIFFSLGSNVKSAQLPAEKRDAILRVFSKLKQKVLWKWEDDQLPGKPDNVMVGKWLPQSDILAHPNLKLFISHCGLGSVNEAKYHGVPIMGIPIYGDQPTNLKRIHEEGWAVELNYGDLSEESFSKTLNEILSNSKYGETIKTISNLYRDRPQSAMDTAVFWVEYVIRHKGAKHMQSQAVHLNFFQYNSLDVLGFILVVFYVIIKILKFIFKFTINKCKNAFKRKKE